MDDLPGIETRESLPDCSSSEVSRKNDSYIILF